MNLGLEKTRLLLMSSSEVHAGDWVSWRSSTDNQLEDMIDSLRSGQLRMAKGLSEFSRKHPLILLRKSPCVVRALELDAEISLKGYDEIRGTVHGRALSGPRDANFMGKRVMVTIRHWGYSYSEPVWVAFLDIITSAPREVLFGCGLSIGLLDILAVYLKLMSVQLPLITTDKSKRIKSKLFEVFDNFQRHNPKGWKKWLAMAIEKGEVRHLLMSCNFITPQQAIDSLKRAPLEEAIG